jgi:hypothetical protein
MLHFYINIFIISNVNNVENSIIIKEVIMEENKIEKRMTVYYAQCLEQVGVFEVLELVLRTVEDTWFVGIEKKDKQAFLFSKKDIDKCIFFDRKDALMTVKEAELNCKRKFTEEKVEEEY